MKFSKLFVAASLLAVAAFGSAQSIVGTWKGAVEIDTKQLQVKTEQERARAMQGLSMLKRMKVNLTLNKDNTFKSTLSGSPTGKQLVNTGTYKVVGTQVVMRYKTVNGQPAQGQAAEPQIGKISADKQKMVFTFPGGGGAAKMVFSRLKSVRLKVKQ